MESFHSETSWQFALLLAQEAETNQVDILAIALRAVHILSAIILGGGIFYIKAILSPAGPDACYAGRRAVWAKWVGMATGLLLVSGIVNFLLINKSVKAAGEKLVPAYHMLFGIKFLLALLVMFVASILAGKTALADRFREKSNLWLNVSWLSVVAIIVIAAFLRTLH